MRGFKVGDRVITHAYTEPDIHSCVATEMNQFIGKEGEITTIHENGVFDIHGWSWPASALTLVDTEQDDKTNTEREQTSKAIHDMPIPKKIRRFETGAVRSDNKGRVRPDWVSPYAIEEISKVLVDNENDFGACNYFKGIPETDCLESLCRHVEELKEALLIAKNNNAARQIARSVGFNITAMLHTMVLKEKGLYKVIHNNGTEII